MSRRPLIVLFLAGFIFFGHSTLNAQSTARATVQGRISVKPKPAQKIANRYAGAVAPGTEQQMPIIVYLRGAGLPPAKSLSRAPEMGQQDTTFSPGYLIVPRGTTVQFRNHDPFYHNVFSYSKAKRFDLGRFPRPEAKSVTFDKVGKVDVFCEIHRSMRGMVLVTDNDFHTTASADGSYALRDVPAGKYQLVVLDPDHGERVVSITVPASGILTVNAAF
jgi:plastocyanin